ncbi:MAG: DUF11 domain-containing protein [Anaerolineae bacterium]|nr:DUF11 domain-containing protein [Anaerolineae bacterium]
MPQKPHLRLLIMVCFLGTLLFGSGASLIRAEDAPHGEPVFDHFVYVPMVFRPLPSADLVLSITSLPRPYVAGMAIVYTVTVSNIGPAISPALTLTQTLPPALLNPVFIPSAGIFDPVTGAWQGVDLAVGNRVTLNIVATVAPTFSGTLRTVVAVVPAGAYDPNPANNQAEDMNPVLPLITNALLNPGFEGITQPGWYTYDTYNGSEWDNIMTPEGWVTWWEETMNEVGLQRGRPEVMPILFEGYFVTPVPRVRSGHWALKFFTFWRPHRGGLYQTVENLPAGSHATLSAYAHAWSCNQDDTGALSCGEDPYQFGFRVGIDPTGGSNPWSSDVIWSDMAYIYDVYDLVGPVAATVGQEGRITVFLLSEAKWGNKHEDAYWDDVSLIITP